MSNASFVELRFTTCHDMVSKAIRMACYGSLYSHVEIVLPNGDCIAAHAGSGVAVQSRADIPARTIRRQSYLIPCQKDQEIVTYSFLTAQLAKLYDYSAIAAIALSPFRSCRNWIKPDRWFCSELSAAALVKAGILGPSLTEFSSISPRDLRLIILGMHGIVTQPEERFAT